jgi:hypothetical protein
MLTDEEKAGDQAMENGCYFAAEQHYQKALAAIGPRSKETRKDRKRIENKLYGAIDCQLEREGK